MVRVKDKWLDVSGLFLEGMRVDKSRVYHKGRRKNRDT